jgi:hypothetical protein
VCEGRVAGWGKGEVRLCTRELIYWREFALPLDRRARTTQYSHGRCYLVCIAMTSHTGTFDVLEV